MQPGVRKPRRSARVAVRHEPLTPPGIVSTLNLEAVPVKVPGGPLFRPVVKQSPRTPDGHEQKGESR